MSPMSKSRVHRSTSTIPRHEFKQTDSSSLERNSVKNQATSHKKRRQCFVRFTLLFLGIVGLSIVRYPSFIERYAHNEGEIVVKLDETITAPLNPERERLQGLDHFYMLPFSNATADGKPKGILLYLHSCKQSGLEFFTLPEHRIIAYDAIQKGLVVFSPTSHNRNSGCYTSEDSNGYLERVVNEFVRKHRLHQLPRVGLGDSSGGAFLSFVHQALKLESMAVYNSPQSYGEIDSLDIQESTAIPTVYVTMSTDTSILNRMNDNKIRLQELNISSYLYKVSPRPFTESLCAARLPELTDGFCEHIFETIVRDHSNLLDADGYVLEGDVKSAQWQRCFDRLELDYRIASPTHATDVQILYHEARHSSARAQRSWLRVTLEQEIQTCYGFHAMTAQFHDEVMEFLMLSSKMQESTSSSQRIKL